MYNTPIKVPIHIAQGAKITIEGKEYEIMGIEFNGTITRQDGTVEKIEGREDLDNGDR